MKLLEPQKIKKSTRLQVRIDDDNFHLLECAARYKRETLSRFIRDEAVRAARRVIQEHEPQTLSPQDWQIFFEALMNPPKPNANLKKAIARFYDKK